jgi:protein-S-isoprenylcysteine O-methyltransferase Ste14
MSHTPWWKGSRGEWYVLIQFALFALVILGLRNVPGWPIWEQPYQQIGAVVGSLLMAVGGLLLVSGGFKLGMTNLTALPHPKDQGVLRQNGPFRFVRHPMYSGGIIMAFGWALFIHGWLTLVYAIILFAFFDLKSRREERWLRDKFPGYAEYQTRTRKLIPFLY